MTFNYYHSVLTCGTARDRHHLTPVSLAAFLDARTPILSDRADLEQCRFPGGLRSVPSGRGRIPCNSPRKRQPHDCHNVQARSRKLQATTPESRRSSNVPVRSASPESWRPSSPDSLMRRGQRHAMLDSRARWQVIVDKTTQVVLATRRTK